MKIIFIIMALCLIGCNDPTYNTKQNKNNLLSICKKEFAVDFAGVDWFKEGVNTYAIKCIPRRGLG